MKKVFTTRTAMLQKALARLTPAPTTASSGTSAKEQRLARRRGARYLYLPHSGAQERARRLRQAYYGQLARNQFRSRDDFDAASMLYLEFVAGRAIA